MPHVQVQEKLSDLLEPEDLAELQRATRKSIDSLGTFVPVPKAAYRRLALLVEKEFQPELEAVRDFERSTSVESVKLRLR